MNESLDMVKEYEKLIRQQPILEQKIIALKDELDSLGAEVEKLRKEKKTILEAIKAKEDASIKKIKEYKDNMDSVIAAESARIEKESLELEDKKKKSEEDERDLKQRENEVTAREDQVSSKEIKNRHTEITLASLRKEKQETLDKITLASIQARALDDKILKDTEGLRHTKKDATDALARLKETQESIYAQEKELAEQLKDVKAEREALAVDAAHVDEKRAALGKQEKAVNEKIAFSNKKQKDSKDKERSLNAMKNDLDFREAKIKAKEKK